MNAYDTGKRIAWLRRDKGMTKQQLADQLHVEVKDIRKWENGYAYPDLYVMARLSETLEIPVTELLGLRRNSSEQAISAVIELAQEEKIRSAEKMRFRGYILAFFGAVIALCLALYPFILKRGGQMGYGMSLFHICASIMSVLISYNGMQSSDKADEILKCFRKED